MFASYAGITGSLIEVGLAVPVVISSVDGEVRGIDVVALQRCLEQLRVVHCAVFQEVQLLVLSKEGSTFMFTPQILSSSASTFRS